MKCRADREKVLRSLVSVSPGLSQREILQQSMCLVFHKGRVHTFNDVIACSAPTPLEMEGAVRAKNCIDILSKVPDKIMEFETKGKRLHIRGAEGAMRETSIVLEEEVLLPIESIEKPDTWETLDGDFFEAVGVVHSCAAKDTTRFALTCVEIHPNYLQACDTFQIARFPISINVKRPVLVAADAIQRISGCGMTAFAETPSWMHFKNEDGLVVSCRKWIEDYPNLDKFVETVDGESITLPGGLNELVDRLDVFAQDNVAGSVITIDLRKDLIIMQGDGAYGWHKEALNVNFEGEPIQFMIPPKLLLSIADKAASCLVSEGKLVVTSSKFTYVTCTTPETDVTSKEEETAA